MTFPKVGMKNNNPISHQKPKRKPIKYQMIGIHQWIWENQNKSSNSKEEEAIEVKIKQIHKTHNIKEEIKILEQATETMEIRNGDATENMAINKEEGTDNMEINKGEAIDNMGTKKEEETDNMGINKEEGTGSLRMKKGEGEEEEEVEAGEDMEVLEIEKQTFKTCIKKREGTLTMEIEILGGLVSEEKWMKVMEEIFQKWPIGTKIRKPNPEKIMLIWPKIIRSLNLLNLK